MTLDDSVLVFQDHLDISQDGLASAGATGEYDLCASVKCLTKPYESQPSSFLS